MRLNRLPLLALLLPLFMATASHSAPDSAPAPAAALEPAQAPPRPVPPPAGKALAELNQKAQKEFSAGATALSEAKFDEARASFDTAIDFYLNAPDPVRADPAFSAWYRDLAERIADLEIPAAAADSEAQPANPEPELTPAEQALQTPTLLSPEELARLKALIASAPPSKASDVPITINDDVLKFISYLQGPGKPVMADGLNRAGRYLKMMRAEFAAAGMPQDLVWIALEESNFKTSAYSHAHARGIWQFISSTGTMYGLKSDYWVDERADPEKSVKAAVRYLKDLYDSLGDWSSAMAGYNSGEGNVRKARRRTGQRDYFRYSRRLPRETRAYVPIIMAGILIAKDPVHYGFTDLDPDPPLKTDTVSVIGPVRLSSAAEAFKLPAETLALLNPELIHQAVPAGGYLLHVPEGSGKGLEAAAKALPIEEIPIEVDAFSGWNRTHRVRRGQTLASIARRYHVSRELLAQANGLSPGAKLHAGVRLRVPGRSGKASRGRGRESVKMKLGQKATFRVRSGDTLYSIARRYHTSAAAIQKWNHLSGSNVPVGRSLVVYYGLGE